MGYLLATLLVTALPLAAQQDRLGIIDQARAESDLRVALDTYLIAAEPVAIDSLWSVSVFEIAQILRDLDDAAASDTWLRWAARLGPQWPIDPDWFTPTLVTAYGTAVQAVETTEGDDSALETSWSWPDRYVPGSGGTIVVVATDPSIELTVTLDDAASATGSPAALGAVAGTHFVEATAADHEPRRIEVEVLPGVSATLVLEMIPLLRAEVAQAAMSKVLRLRYNAAPGRVCTNVVSLQAGLLVGALAELQEANDLELLIDDRIYDDVEIIERDEETGLAFVQVRDGPTLAPWPREPVGTGFAWSVHRSGCDAGAATTRLRTQDTGDEFAVELLPSLYPAAAGAPIVGTSGAMLGVIVGSGRVTPVNRVEAASQVVAARLGRGGFPFKWVGAGVAAAAGALVYLLGGDDASTGSIVIDIPAN